MHDQQFEVELEVIAGLIDDLDYFQVLKIEQDATPGQIKAAYYRESRSLHPDKFFSAESEELKNNALKVYKRVTEAYMVLKDHQKRAKYLADINGPDRASKLRFSEESEREQKQGKEEEPGKTAPARQSYRQAVLQMHDGQWDKARRSLKTALMYEPDNELFRSKLEECQERLAEGSR